MSYGRVPAGLSLPDDFYALIEIPENIDPIKYEVNKEYDALFIDRFLTTAMFYPANYGYIPKTLSEDGDPIDVLVFAPYPVAIGSVIRSRPIGVMYMEDEHGVDAKIIAVPHSKLTLLYHHVHELADIELLKLQRIQHFFENYKALEEGKWVKFNGWGDANAARAEIIKAAQHYPSHES